MEKLYKILLCACLVLGISACQKKVWDEHFNDDDQHAVVSPLNLLDYLKTVPNYSRFVEKLEELGVAEQLTRDQNLSVWVVTNAQMDRLASMGLDERYVMLYHINHLTFDFTKLKAGTRVQTLNGKYIQVERTSETIFVGDSYISNGNQLCRNGVVHEINELMRPDESIYDYLSALGDDYSIIRDSVLALNDTVFDEQNSIPIGVDPTGNTLYDSVFVITNPIFEVANFRSEFAQVTLFLPSNAVIEQCFENLGELYEQFGKAFTPADSLIAYQWIREAVFYGQIIDDYGSQRDLVSAFGKFWRTDIQQVDPNFRRMSNGRIYEITHLKIPNNVHIQMIKQLFHYWEFVPEGDKPALFTLHNVTDIVPTNRDHVTFPTLGIELTYRTLMIRGDLVAGQPASIDFTPVLLEQRPDGSSGYRVVEVPPGEYNLYMGFRSSAHPFVNIYVDGKPVTMNLNVVPATPWNYDRATNTVPGTRYNGWGGLVGPVVIEGDQVRSFRIKVEFAGLSSGSIEQMEPYHWALVPTQNNY
ncbi:fasciclin domain-containing protein [Parapedobacter tibetensis]|uniref:fasciclin domain-containing protein n=1 Tax=Parapedobacter tibetensis TaxID=2972951 RepID=UPI00214DEC5A|nr:fasciclin domain-containing protein [Parapedobacter tibetensis]